MQRREDILNLLEQRGGLDPAEIGAMLDLTVEEVDQALAELREQKILVGSTAIINWEKTGRAPVTAMIEVSVTPQRDLGFDAVARRIHRFPQVKSCYLMSGGFDLLVVVEDVSLKAVAMFVSEKIAPLEAVLSTRTHFVLKPYKKDGFAFDGEEPDTRQPVVL